MLTHTGETAGHRPFSRGFEDGALVAYVVKDSGGVITCSGLGTWDATAKTTTRNDTENDNGTVTDKNPATNITLSAGTHTIGCDLTAGRLPENKDSTVFNAGFADGYFLPDNILDQKDTVTTMWSDSMAIVKVLFSAPTLISSFFTMVTTADAAATNFRRGIYDANLNLLIDSGNIDVSTTGNKVTALSTPLLLQPGEYWLSSVSNSLIVKCRAIWRDEVTPLNLRAGVTATGCMQFTIDGITGALPVKLSFANFVITNKLPVSVGFR